MADFRDELAVIEHETVSPDEVQRATALFDPIWDMLLPRERSPVNIGRKDRPDDGQVLRGIEHRKEVHGFELAPDWTMGRCSAGSSTSTWSPVGTA
jgi:hypothetical protein